MQYAFAQYKNIKIIIVYILKFDLKLCILAEDDYYLVPPSGKKNNNRKLTERNYRF